MAGERADLGRCAHRLIVGEVLLPGVIEFAPFVDIGEEDAGLDDMLEVGAGLLHGKPPN
jgi:hypothetical protein